MKWPKRWSIYDPHGDPIPDSNGQFKKHELKPVSTIGVNDSGVISSVRDHSTGFLQYLEKQKLTIGKKITVIEIIEYDHSMILKIENETSHISREVANNLLIAL